MMPSAARKAESGSLQKRLRDCAGLQERMDALAPPPGETRDPSIKTMREAADYLDVLEARIKADVRETSRIRPELAEARALLWIGWKEMNAIRAMSGVPLNFDGNQQGISEAYWSEAVDKMAEFLSRYGEANPWPPDCFKLTWKNED